MRKFRFVALAVLVAALSAIAASAASASAPPRIVGEVYVNDNTAGVNTVAGYYRHSDGTLTAIPGSPFAVGGAGTGHATASQGSLELSPDGRYLLVVDAGSNQISVLRINPDGSLRIADGGPVSSNGGNPVSIAISNDLVYVANADPNSPNYTGFRLGFGGHLFPIPGSTVSLPAGSQPGDVLFSADGRRVVGTRVGTSQIDSFLVGFDGRLHAALGSPFAAQGLGPFGSEFNPANPFELFVSNAHGGTGNGSVSAFIDGFGGNLTSINGSPVPDLQTAPCWVEISHNGRYLFAVNTAVATISSYSIGWNGSLTLLGSTAMRAPAGGPEDARLSPDGTTLWVVDSGTDAISAFSVNGGSLTELPSSPTAGPAGATPSGIVVT
jgi:6-phosphogluconolactonase (cycloisomerase 2 family)